MLSVRPWTVDRVCDHSFLPALLGNDPAVLDLGANHGDFTKILVDRYGARSIAVEPNPALVGSLTAAGATSVVAAAVTVAPGPVRLAVFANDQSSTLHAGAPIDGRSEVEVDGVTLGDLLGRFPDDQIDLLKLDIEGMEIEALGTLDTVQLERLRQMTVEFHDAQGFTPVREIRRLCHRLARSGFCVVRMSVRHRGDVLFVRRDALRRRDRWMLRWVERPRQFYGRFRARRG